MSVWESEFSAVNARNERLSGLLTASRELVPGDSVTILCHGFTSSKRSRLLTALTSGLVAAYPAGHGVARFDFAGNGDSEGSFSYANYAGEAEDLRSVVEYLRGRGLNVHAVLGHSKGAAVVVLYAGKYGDVKHVVNLAGRLRMERGIRERFGDRAMGMMERGEPHSVRTRRTDGTGNVVDFVYEVRIEDVRERLATDVLAAVRKLSKGVRVLTVHGAKDETIPVQDGKDLHAAVEDGEIIVLDDAGHSFEGFEQNIVDAVAKFCFDRVEA